MFIAHRGNDNHSYRENSEKGIMYCLEKNYIAGIECDIRLTKDSKIVLLHNMAIDLISDGSGIIHNMPLAELLLYNFSNEKITVLSSLLDNINSNKILLLEIKEERQDVEHLWVEALTKIINKYYYLNIYLCSFNYELITKLKDKFNIPIGLIIGYQMNKNKDSRKFDFIMYQYKNFKYGHKATMVWTVNDKEKADELKNRVDYIITDKAYELL